MLTRQRFLDICHFKRPGDLCLVTCFNLFWPETPLTWAKQGAPGFFEEPLLGFSNRRIDNYFGFEDVRWLAEIDSGVASTIRYSQFSGTTVVDPNMLLHPEFEHRFIEDDGRTLTFLNSAGQTIKVFKDKPINMPLYLDWPVKDRATWQEFRKRLDPNTPGRWPADWAAYVRQINDLTCPVALQVGGFFGFMREWVGTERVLYLFYDDPGLVEDIMDTLLFMEMEIIKRVVKDIRFEMATYWEDMAYKGGPLISPNMVRKFMMPRYKKLNDLLHRNGVDVIFVDSDGDLDLLIPLWLECGINFVWPLEVAAGNDPISLRNKYSTDLIIGGAIDKRAFIKDKKTIKEEVMSKVPFLMEKGAYFPSVDHLVPPDVPFENYRYFINLIREIAGVEKLPF